MSGELQREVTRDDDSIKFALKWTDAMLRRWLDLSTEAAVFVGDPRRTLDQNSKLWPMLADVAGQVEWHGQKLSTYDWKDVFTAALKRYRVVPGIDGGLVVLGMRTSRMSKKDFSDLIELMYSFGADHNVVWSEPAKELIEQHRKAA